MKTTTSYSQWEMGPRRRRPAEKIANVTKVKVVVRFRSMLPEPVGMAIIHRVIETI